MGRALPSRRSGASLLTILCATTLYAASSSGGIKLSTWVWALIYVAVLSFEMVYVKHVLNNVPMSTWTRVYYNNALAFCLSPPFLILGHEYSKETSPQPTRTHPSPTRSHPTQP